MSPLTSSTASVASSAGATPLLNIRNLSIQFDGASKPAVSQVSLALHSEQTVAIVGESGSGKSLTALSVMGLLPGRARIAQTSEITFRGRDGITIELSTCNEPARRKIRGARIAMIFQEPMTSLNPVFTVGSQIIEAIYLHQTRDHAKAHALAIDALHRVGIAEPARRLSEYPHQMSGGMKQRIMIAMALACEPSVLIADEPTTALDVTIQAQILELMRSLQEQSDMGILLITHDLGVVAENADVVAVMYAGKIVEYATVYDLFDNPMHPYTKGLLACVPKLGQEHARLFTIPGMVPSPMKYPQGCRFAARCTECQGAIREKELAAHPTLREVKPGHWVASWNAPGYEAAKETVPQLSFRRPKEHAKVTAV